jgi:hypothetical protein
VGKLELLSTIILIFIAGFIIGACEKMINTTDSYCKELNTYYPEVVVTFCD